MPGWGAVAIWLMRIVNEPRYAVEASGVITRVISAHCVYSATICPQMTAIEAGHDALQQSRTRKYFRVLHSAAVRPAAEPNRRSI
jgi:hypothetical protein